MAVLPAKLTFSLKSTFLVVSMRIGVLLCALWIAIAPAMAFGSHRGSSRAPGSRSYSSYSYRSRSSAGSYRAHSYTRRGYRSYASGGSHRRYAAGYSRAYGSGERDSRGRIKRSGAAKNAFKRQQPCPSTGRSRGACPGYVIDHVRPLECGGADAPANMQWQTVSDAKAKDKTERYCR